ncbi:MAG: thioredoxin [Bauldia sp.]|nr:thioredoxin [Bauldia sp.]
MTDQTLNLDGSTPAPAGLVIDTTTKGFVADVIEESKTRPVLVDFWAPWCGPCRTLSPIIEKAVTAANGKVRLAKMNIDDHPSIPGQLGIQSIPAVIAFVNGRPVDGFLGAIPEGQVKAFIDKVVAANGKGAADADPTEALLAEADRLLAEGNPQEAGNYYAAAHQTTPDNTKAIAGLARAAIALGDLAGAREALALAPPPDKTPDAALAAAEAELKLAEETAKLGDPNALQARLAADPADLQARFDLALIENARGNRTEAAEHLLDIFRRDRTWEDDKARTQLIQFFDLWGPKDPATLAGRRRLSALLFS